MINLVKWITTKNVAIALISFILVGIVALGIADAVIYSQGKAKTRKSEECPQLPQGITKIKLDKVFWYGWHRKYEFEDYPVDAKVQQNCPSVTNDAIIFMKGKRVAQTDGKIASTTSKTYIKDCHGDIIYVTRIAKDPWEIVVNSITMKISFEVSDNDGNLLAYVSGSSFWKTEMELVDVFGNSVAKITKDDPFNFSDWEVEIYNLTSPATDPRILTLTAAKQAFSEEDDGDSCNAFFWDVVWIIVGCFGLIVITVFSFAWRNRAIVKRKLASCYSSMK